LILIRDVDPDVQMIATLLNVSNELESPMAVGPDANAPEPIGCDVAPGRDAWMNGPRGWQPGGLAFAI